MALLDLERFLNNFSFACLLSMAVWYWFKLSFSLGVRFHRIGTVGMALANISLWGVLTMRWATSGHFPLSNLYESLLFLSWGLTAFHLILESMAKTDFLGVVTSPVALLVNGFATFSLPRDMQRATALIPALKSNWLMMHVTVMMLSYVALISGSLLAIGFLMVTYYSRKTTKGSGLEDLHTASNIPYQGVAGYFRVDLGLDGRPWSPKGWPTNPRPAGERRSNGAACTLLNEDGLQKIAAAEGFTETPGMAALCQGLGHYPTTPREGLRVSEPPHQPVLLGRGGAATASQLTNQATTFVEPALTGVGNLAVLAQTLDNLSYRALGLGFPLLTIGILSGAVWANEAWGSYWSWDPKETWALITWLVFAIYLHTRLNNGWRGSKPAVIAATGFLVVWMCYLGVNMLGTGLHSYGWFRGADG
jgi:ABC-type transport system involved in cytochrome c biogenesis permease subunit